MSYASLRKWLVVTAAVVSCVGLATTARAADFDFTTSSPQYLGVVTPDGGSPSTEAIEVNDLAAMSPGSTQTIDYGNPAGVQDFDRSSNTLCFNTCPSADSGNVDSSDDTGNNSGTLDGSASYIIGKYDAGQAGMYVWYVAGLSGTFTIPQNLGDCGNNEGCGLSHFIVYGGTGGGGTGSGETGGETGSGETGGTGPEPASLLLFGAALSAAGIRMRRRARVE